MYTNARAETTIGYYFYSLNLRANKRGQTRPAHDTVACSKCTADDIYIDGRYVAIHLQLSRLDPTHTVIT